MDNSSFDELTRSLAIPSRRAVLAVLGAAVAALFGHDGRDGLLAKPHHGRHRNRRHDRGPLHAKRKNKKRKKRKKRKTPEQPLEPPPGCSPDSPAQTCASTCAMVVNNCGTVVDCGPCNCGTCPACHVCNTSTGVCDPNPATVGQLCGSLGQVCQVDGSCVCSGGSCGACRTCLGNGTCSTPCSSGGCCLAGTCVASCPTCQICSGGQCVANTSLNRTDCAGTAPATSVCCDGTCCTGCCGSGDTCGACRVFVTSTFTDGSIEFTGGLVGLAAADAICQAQAVAGGLPGASVAGTYKAWLSDSTADGHSPLSRFRHSQQPYRLPDATNTKVADDWTDLTTCESGICLDNPINVTEGGNGPVGDDVWTNTGPSGAESIEQLDCANWTSADSGVFAEAGHAAQTDSGWTEFEAPTCDATLRLYCFQQS